ncbi:hypothetical protein SLA2020_413780 [Shorea laevis]
MAWRNFYNEIKGLKYREDWTTTMPSTSKPAPLTLSSMSVFGGMIFSYLVALPEERRHLEHQQHAKEHGQGGH